MQIRKGWIPNCSTIAVWLEPVSLSSEHLLKELSEYFMARAKKKALWVENSGFPKERERKDYKVEIYHRYKSTSDEQFRLFDFRTVEEFSAEEIDTDELLKKRKEHEADAPKKNYRSTELVIETEYGSIQYDGERIEIRITKLGTSPKEDWMTELYPYLRQFERILFWDGYGESKDTDYDMVVSFFGNE